ncbi:hypothetical protein ACN28S_36055 [Cystobacter fuscus]
MKRAEDGRVARRKKRPLPHGTTHLLFTVWSFEQVRRRRAWRLRQRPGRNR